jgi:HSP20 family protein
MERAMDRVFDSFWRPFGLSRWGSGMTSDSGRPLALDVYEEDDKLVIKADVPGIKPEDVHVEVTGNVLNLSGEMKDEREEKREGYYIRERGYGSFARSLTLPSGLDTDKVEAAFENGVLSIRIPKTEGAKTKTIKVKAAKA